MTEEAPSSSDGDRELGSATADQAVTAQESAAAEAAMRRILWRLLLVLLALLGVAALLSFLFQDELRTVGQAFVETLGGPGIMLGYFIPDAFLIPLPHEVFTGFGLLGGMDFITIVLWAGVGSLSGGTLGFLIGRRLGHTEWYHRRMRGKAELVELLISRYGSVTLAVAAMSPLPYSVTCWVCGAGGMRLSTFLAVSLVRIPRIVIYLWLIQVGLIAGA